MNTVALLMLLTFSVFQKCSVGTSIGEWSSDMLFSFYIEIFKKYEYCVQGCR